MTLSFRNLLALQKYLGAMLDANHEIARGYPNTGWGYKSQYYRGRDCHEVRANAIQRINRLLPKCLATLDRLKRSLNLDSPDRVQCLQSVEKQLFRIAALIKASPELHHAEARETEHLLDQALAQLRLIPPGMAQVRKPDTDPGKDAGDAPAHPHPSNAQTEQLWKPRDCLPHLVPFSSDPRKRRHHLDVIRKKFPWVRDKTGKLIRSQSFLKVIEAMKKIGLDNSSNQIDRCAAIRALEVDPTVEEIQQGKAKEREFGMRKKRDGLQ